MIKLIKLTNKGSALVELLAVTAILATLTSVVAPIYINNLEKARILADEVQLQNASTLAESMLVMEDLTPGSTLYYTEDATLVSSKSNIKPYGVTSENENSIIMVTVDDFKVDAKWINLN